MAEKRMSALRRSKRRWRIFLWIYSVLFLLLGAAACYTLYRYAEAYENSLPENVMDELMEQQTPEDWLRHARSGAAVSVTEFEDGAALLDEYISASFPGKDISYRKAAGLYSAATPVYSVRCAGVELCTVSLKPVGEKAAGFGRELWQLGEIRSSLSQELWDSVTVEIDAPAGKTLYINGVPVSDAWLTDEKPTPPSLTELESRFSVQPDFERRRVGPLYGEVTVTDENGVTLAPEEIEGGRVRYTADADSFYSVTIKAPESLQIEIGGALLTVEDAQGGDNGVLSGLESTIGGGVEPRLTYHFGGLYTLPPVTAKTPDGRELTPLMNEKGELWYFPAEDESVKAWAEPYAKDFFDHYIKYSSHAYDEGRYKALLALILPGTELYKYVRDSVDAMIWASATQVHYDELSFANFHAVGENCFTCTIRYKADFSAQAWYERYTYDLQNAYELAFIRQGDFWYAAAMSAVAG